MRGLDLAISLLNADGSVGDRWGPDEDAVGDVPKGLTFSTSDPGGFKDASLSLARRIDRQWPDLKLLRPVRIYGAGNRTVWEGRLQEIPLHHAADYSISPGAVGHAAELDDDPSFAEIYIDRDLSKWGEASIQRKLGLLGGSQDLSKTSFTIGTGTGSTLPAILISLIDAQVSFRERQETWYYGNGCDIGRVRYDFIAPKPGGLGASMHNGMWVYKDDVGAGGMFGVAHATTPAANQVTTPSSAGFKYAGTMTENGNEAYVGPTSGDTWGFAGVCVMGRHGLTERGLWPAIGFYASDIVADIVSRSAPGLNFTTGDGGSIEPSEYVIPHLDLSTPGKGSDGVLAVNAYHQRTWGVEDNKRFFWRSATKPRKRWRIRRSKGHGVDLLGPQAEDAVNGVVATFTDPVGMTRVIGPLGCATAYVTSALLEDTSPTNPVNAAGIKRKWAQLSLGFVTDVPGATQVAYAWLVDKLQNANSRGSVIVSGFVEDDATGALYPASEMRAGDSAIVVDGDNIERRIIETNHDNDSHTTTCNMDSTPHKVEAMMERMGVALVGVAD